MPLSYLSWFLCSLTSKIYQIYVWIVCFDKSRKAIFLKSFHSTTRILRDAGFESLNILEFLILQPASHKVWNTKRFWWMWFGHPATRILQLVECRVWELIYYNSFVATRNLQFAGYKFQKGLNKILIFCDPASCIPHLRYAGCGMVNKI